MKREHTERKEVKTEDKTSQLGAKTKTQTALPRKNTVLLVWLLPHPIHSLNSSAFPSTWSMTYRDYTPRPVLSTDSANGNLQEEREAGRQRG